jgi:peptide deformylase
MAVRIIVSLPEPVLRRKAHKVTQFDKDLKVLIEDMVETMRVAPGVGLAAPQVGISSRVIVVEFGKEDDEEAPKKLYAVVNPELTFPDEEKVMGVEACLSVPDLAGEVERYQNVVVKGLDRTGKPIKIKASGWLARIFQHETDHLDGVIFTDRATQVWRLEPQADVEEV